MTIKGDREKQLYCQLFYAAERLQNLRTIYNETRDDRLKGRMTKTAKDIRGIAKTIKEGESGRPSIN